MIDRRAVFAVFAATAATPAAAAKAAATTTATPEDMIDALRQGGFLWKPNVQVNHPGPLTQADMMEIIETLTAQSLKVLTFYTGSKADEISPRERARLEGRIRNEAVDLALLVLKTREELKTRS